MNIRLSRLSRLARWLHGRRPAAARRPPRAAWVPSELPDLEQDTDDSPAKGCGWFDSSHELRQGLAVREGFDAEAAASMPVRDWIDWQLRGVETLRSPATA